MCVCACKMLHVLLYCNHIQEVIESNPSTILCLYKPDQKNFGPVFGIHKYSIRNNKLNIFSRRGNE